MILSFFGDAKFCYIGTLNLSQPPPSPAFCSGVIAEFLHCEAQILKGLHLWCNFFFDHNFWRGKKFGKVFVATFRWFCFLDEDILNQRFFREKIFLELVIFDFVPPSLI